MAEQHAADSVAQVFIRFTDTTIGPKMFFFPSRLTDELNELHSIFLSFVPTVTTKSLGMNTVLATLNEKYARSKEHCFTDLITSFILPS